MFFIGQFKLAYDASNDNNRVRLALSSPPFSLPLSKNLPSFPPSGSDNAPINSRHYNTEEEKIYEENAQEREREGRKKRKFS